MGFAHYFPVTFWIWKEISSRAARRVWLGLLLLWLATSLVLRARAAIFAREVRLIALELHSLRLGARKEIVLRSVPQLRRHVRTPNMSPCYPIEECYAFEDQIVKDDSLVWCFIGNQAFRWLLYSLGWRQAYFTAYARFERNTLASFGYWAQVDRPEHDACCGGINVSAESPPGLQNVTDRDFLVDENPEIQIRRDRKLPQLSLNVHFTPEAPREMRHHAFDPVLSCLWLAGCRSADQILPESAADKDLIEETAIRRLQGNDPCPANVIRRRYTDYPNVLLVRLLRTELHRSNETYIVPHYQLIRLLKGRLQVRFDRIAIEAQISRWKQRPLPNPGYRYQVPGQSLVLFTSYGVEGPCAVVPASERNMKLIDEIAAMPQNQDLY